MSAPGSKGMVVITAPLRVRSCMPRVPKTKERKRSVQPTRPGGTVGDINVQPIIDCKNRKLNFYKGQTYGKFETVPLASELWKGRKSKGDFFTINNYSQNPAFVKPSETSDDFEQLGLDSRIVEQLKKIGFKNPTNIQTLAIPHVLNGENTMIAAETGNGKTLAFLAPIVHQLLNSGGLDHNSGSSMNSPRALVITPGRELVIQTRDMARALAFDLGLNVNSIVGGKTKRMSLYPKLRHTDILVGTFGCLSKLVTCRIVKLNRVNHIVLDEADTLLDDTFIDHVSHFLSKFAISADEGEERKLSGAQLTFVGATFPKTTNEVLSKIVDIDSLVSLKTPYLHRVSPHIKQTFVKMNPDSKPENLLKLAKNNQRKSIPTIIFCNTSKTCDWLSMFLNENGIPCTHLNGAMSYECRIDKFEKFQNEESLFLSCTDLVSRGLNTVRAKHILNYDFPNFMADYIHRCGRTGRVGSENNCRVTSFVAKQDEAVLVQKIEYALRKIDELPSVNANIKRMITENTERYERRSERRLARKNPLEREEEKGSWDETVRETGSS